MPSLKADFNELLERIRHGREFGHASFEPIYYLVFSPQHILDVKRQTPAWIAKLRHEGWEVTVFSIAEAIADILGQAPLRQIWLDADRKAPLEWDKTNRSLANILARGALQTRLEAELESLEGQPMPLSWSQIWKRCIRTCGLESSKANCKASFACPQYSCTPGSELGRRISNFWGFIPRMATIVRSTWVDEVYMDAALIARSRQDSHQ